MFATVTSAATVGIEPQPVRVEVHARQGKLKMSVVGLPDTAVRESRERVRAAIAASGFDLPRLEFVVNLAPAGLPKVGSVYDLPIALGVLQAAGRIRPSQARQVVAVGELALDGSVRSVPGSLAAVLVAREQGVPCLVPPGVRFAADLGNGSAVGVDHLLDAVAVIEGRDAGRPVEPTRAGESPPGVDLAEIRGQAEARRALEIAAAGGHHLLMVGPPGAGKTMLARCLPTILPDLSPEHRLEVAQAYDTAGLPLPSDSRPPFRSPHHSATMPAVVGGGQGIPRPGEITLAHRGVLFLDELGEFPRHVLDSLRQPVEEGWVVVVRRGGAARFPARFRLVGAANPCPCGFKGDRLQGCGCSTQAVARYRRRFSGPLLDRMDLRLWVGRVLPRDLVGPGGESSAVVRARVVAARARQEMRGSVNAELSRRQLDGLVWSAAAVRVLEAAADEVVSARGWDRVRRVARTIADLAGSEVVEGVHVEEALEFRGER